MTPPSFGRHEIDVDGCGKNFGQAAGKRKKPRRMGKSEEKWVLARKCSIQLFTKNITMSI